MPKNTDQREHKYRTNTVDIQSKYKTMKLSVINVEGSIPHICHFCLFAPCKSAKIATNLAMLST